MAKNEQQKPQSILEALGTRGEETEPEVTTEEHVTEALSSASLMDRLESEQYPEGEIPMQRGKFIGERPTITITNLHETDQRAILASNTAPPPVAETSIQESQEQPPQVINHDELCRMHGIDPNLRRLKDFVGGELYSVNWVRMHLMHVSRMPSALPSPTLWKVPKGVEVANLVYDIVLSPGYVENTWPTLEILLGSSIDNTEWCVGVLTTLAVFDAIRLLAYIPED